MGYGIPRRRDIIKANKKDLRTYSWAVLWHDLLAGLAVSLLSIPQALAYSIVVACPLTAFDVYDFWNRYLCAAWLISPPCHWSE